MQGHLVWESLESLRLPHLVSNPRLQSLAKEERRKRRKRRKSPRLGFFMLSLKWSHGGCWMLCKLEKVWLVIQFFRTKCTIYLKWSARIGANWPVNHQSMSSLSRPLSMSSAQTILWHMTFLTFRSHTVHTPTAFRYTKAQIKHPHLHLTRYSLKACVFPDLLNLFTPRPVKVPTSPTVPVSSASAPRFRSSALPWIRCISLLVGKWCNLWNWKLRQTGAEAGIGCRLDADDFSLQGFATIIDGGYEG